MTDATTPPDPGNADFKAFLGSLNYNSLSATAKLTLWHRFQAKVTQTTRETVEEEFRVRFGADYLKHLSAKDKARLHFAQAGADKPATPGTTDATPLPLHPLVAALPAVKRMQYVSDSKALAHIQSRINGMKSDGNTPDAIRLARQSEIDRCESQMKAIRSRWGIPI